MSLIEEALRQVQDVSPPSSRTPSPASLPRPPISAPSRASSQPAARTPSGMLAAVVASLALIGLLGAAWLAGAVWRQANPSHPELSESPAPIPPSPATSAMRRSPFSAQPARVAPASAPMAFVLNGIMNQGGEKVAIVNNTIVQTGDLVDGARVLEVRSDSVWLRAKNQDTILKTNR